MKQIYLNIYKRFNNLLLNILLISALCVQQIKAQTTVVQVGNGTNTSTNMPITANYGYSYTQQIYSADQLQSTGCIVGAPIHKIKFYLYSGPNPINNSSSWVVYMGSTTKSSFSSNDDWIGIGSLSQVYSGTVLFPGLGNWMEITLDNPFMWNGVENLVIAVDENMPNYSSSNVFWRSFAVSNNQSIYYRNDNNNPNPNSPPPAIGLSNNLNNLQFTFEQTPCSGIPNAANIIASDTNVCIGNSIILTTQNNNGVYSGINYQWQSSIDGSVGWQNINGAANLYYGLQSTTDQWYRAILTCGVDVATSSPIQIQVKPLPNLTLNNNEIVICNGVFTPITASGAQSYRWAPNVNLNIDTGSTVFVNATTTRTYVVTGTGDNGCIDTASVLVTPLKLSKPAYSIGYADSCGGGTAVTITLDSVLMNQEYKIIDTLGNTISDWQNNGLFSFIPSREGNLKYYLLVRNNACTNNISDTIVVNLLYGITASVTSTVACTPELNSFNITNPEGLSLLSIQRVYDFSNSTIPSDTTLYASAFVDSGRFVLTPSGTGLRGGLSIDSNGINPKTITIDFLLTADQPINNYGTGGADAISWSFGDDAVYSSYIYNGGGFQITFSF
jgi:hypothetical protein